MWLVILCGLPGAGKSFFRDKFTRAIMQRIQSTAYDLHSPIDEHELAALRFCQDFRMVQASSDDVIDMIAACQKSTYSAVFDKYKNEADLAFWHRLRLGIATRAHVVIADRTFVSEKSRKAVIDIANQQAKDAGVTFKTMMLEFTTPPYSEWVERLNSRPGKVIPEAVLQDMAKRQQSCRNDAMKYDRYVEFINPENQPGIIQTLVGDVFAGVPEFGIAA